MRLRDDNHLAFIRTLPCVLCGDNTSTEACHIRMQDPRIGKPITGIGIKPDDRYTLPMCGKHHRMQHQMSERKFWEMYGRDAVLLALAIHSVSGDAQAAERHIQAMRHAGE